MTIFRSALALVLVGLASTTVAAQQTDLEAVYNQSQALAERTDRALDRAALLRLQREAAALQARIAQLLADALEPQLKDRITAMAVRRVRIPKGHSLHATRCLIYAHENRAHVVVTLSQPIQAAGFDRAVYQVDVRLALDQDLQPRQVLSVSP